MKPFAQKVAQAQQAGYYTDMCFMTADANSLLDGSLDRYARKGRIVPLNRILQSSIDAQSAVPQLFNMLDNVKVYNRTGNRVTLIAKGGKGKKTTYADQKLWDNFQDSNAYHLDSGATIMYNNKFNAIKQKRKRNISACSNNEIRFFFFTNFADIFEQF